MPEKDDSAIKNKFYSTLRKGLRKMNKYIVNIKKKSDPVKYKALKVLEELFLTKVIAVVDDNFTEKYEVKRRALELASSKSSAYHRHTGQDHRGGLRRAGVPPTLTSFLLGRGTASGRYYGVQQELQKTEGQEET
jgi:hypothetical protein